MIKYIRRQDEKYSIKPTTNVKLRTSGCWVGTQTGVVSPPH